MRSRRVAGAALALTIALGGAGGVLAACIVATAALADELPVPVESPEQVRQTADDVLARQEFQRPPDPWFERVQETVLDYLGRALNALFEGGAGTAAAWIVVGLIVGGLVFFGLRIGRTVRADLGRALEVAVTPRTTPAEWRARAEGFEADGDWKQALRCRYRALIGDLVDRDVVRDIPGRTAGEFRRELATTAPDAAGPFADASDLFERAWYGSLPTGPDESARFQADAARVEGR